MRHFDLMGLPCGRGRRGNHAPLCVQRNLFGLLRRLRRLLEGVLEPGGGSLVVASDYDRALSPLITEAAAKPTSIGGPFAAQDLGIPCLLSMNMAVPSLSSRLSPDLGDKPPVQFESNPGLGCRRGRDVAHHLWPQGEIRAWQKPGGNGTYEVQSLGDQTRHIMFNATGDYRNSEYRPDTLLGPHL